MQDDAVKFRLGRLDDEIKQKAALTVRVQQLEAALLNIYQVWQMRSELFTSDEDCAANLADRAKQSLAVARGDCEAQSRDEPHALGDNEREALITALREIAERSYDPASSETAQAALTKLEK